jgi:cytochrome c
MPKDLRPLIVFSFLFLFACASSMTPRANTRDEVVAYVDRAAAIVAKSGPSCDTFKSSQWMSGDWYVYVQDANGTLVCHPMTSMVGKPASEIVDATGRHIGDELSAAAASTSGHGWVDYVWPRPGTTTPVPKSTYATRVTGPDGKTYAVGAGGYELK